MTLLALTRELSDSIGRCELTHVEREGIDAQRARQQHAAYEAALTAWNHFRTILMRCSSRILS